MNRARTDFLRKLSDYFKSLPFSVSGKTLCVGLSGGADSVSLLLGLRELAERFEFTVSACHFNHMIRGDEADYDEAFCKQLCKRLDIKLYCGRDDVPAYAKTYKLGIEESARNCRYSFFDRILAKPSVDFCVTAHNMNDDAETLLINLFRGSGSNGASAIAAYTDKVLRPLLKVGREEIEAYLNEIGQDYVTDSTNLCNDYTRNYIRNIVIPEVEKLNPSVVQALSRFAQSCRDDREYFETIVNESINCDLRTLPKAIRSRIILKKYKEYSGASLNSDMLRDIERAIFENKRICLPLFENTETIIDNGKVVFDKKSKTVDFEYDEQVIEFGNNKLFGERIDIELSKVLKENININKLSTTAFLSFDKINGTIKARNRHIGDKIYINGVHKSLKKLFIDKKIPKEYRNIIPIILDDEGIIYVPFVGIADRVRDNDNSQRVFINTVFNSIDQERWTNAYEK